jgi:inosine-uridine nucleoside N-ribohydrolase
LFVLYSTFVLIRKRPLFDCELFCRGARADGSRPAFPVDLTARIGSDRPMRLIIDTDTAGDDVFSLMLALRRPGVSVEAITIAHGNVGFEQHAENALVTLEACERGGEVPVYLGAQRPFTRAPLDAAYVFGADGMSDSGFPKAVQRPSPGHAADEIVRRVMERPARSP